ncbi:MAG: hypothetical protein PHI90_10375 [Clostridia bacterium]|nr:hypothetical protein [Clostridia bacterium]MDD4049194.1 hypothetical protein [Clostridia bacterium]
MSDENKAQKLISIFVCKRDPDIENFLKEKAIIFEKLGKSRTFLIFDEEDEKFKVVAYFTLALQILKIPEEFSNRKIKIFDGFNAKINGKRITEFPTILIGQFGKNELFKDCITGDKVMRYCLGVMLEGQIRLGGRIVMLECKDIPYLLDFYERYGFLKIEKDYEVGELIQLVKVLQKDEIINKVIKL